MNRNSYVMLLAAVLCAFSAQASPPPLPELTIDLASIGAGTCREVEWPLPHVHAQVVVCHVPESSAPAPAAGPAAFPVDAPELRRQALLWREASVNEELAAGIQTMQLTLDAVPHRSLHPDWRVLMNQGALGCKPMTEITGSGVSFTDPCNRNRYGADGRALGQGYPALAIPPYVIQGQQLVLGRLPASSAKPEPLPEITFTAAPDSSPAERLVRAARWGAIPRARELLHAGADINGADEGGSTALLMAVNMRQNEMVAFLISRGADVNRRYPSGLSALEIARIVTAPELEAMLLKAGATTGKLPPLTSGDEARLKGLLARLPEGFFEITEFISEDGSAEFQTGISRTCLSRADWKPVAQAVLQVDGSQTSHMECSLLQREIGESRILSRVQCRQRPGYALQDRGELRDELRFETRDRLVLIHAIEALERSLDGEPQPDLRRTTRQVALLIGDRAAGRDAAARGCER